MGDMTHYFAQEQHPDLGFTPDAEYGICHCEKGGLTFTVLETPGHSPGSVTYRCEDALFTGDTLFRDSCGRTDLPGGDMETLMGSLLKLYDLPGDYEVYPGHMDSSTLARERAFNYYMRYANEQVRGQG